MGQKKLQMTNIWTVALGAMVCCALWGSAFPCIKIGYQMFGILGDQVGTQILFAGIDKRIAVFLIKESEEIGKDKIKITHEQLAKYIGSAREVVSRMLKYFEQEGFVSLGRGSIEIVDKNELVKITR